MKSRLWTRTWIGLSFLYFVPRKPSRVGARPIYDIPHLKNLYLSLQSDCLYVIQTRRLSNVVLADHGSHLSLFLTLIYYRILGSSFFLRRKFLVEIAASLSRHIGRILLYAKQQSTGRFRRVGGITSRPCFGFEKRIARCKSQQLVKTFLVIRESSG